MRLLHIMVILVCFPTQSAVADSYKCKLPNGSTEIRDSPCVGSSASVSTVKTYENTAEEAARVNAARRENQRQLDWANEQSDRRYNEEQAVREKRRQLDRMEAQQAANQRAAAEKAEDARRQQQLLDEVKQIRANQENSKNQKMSCFQYGAFMDCKAK
jgi:hypothetical protein